MVALGIGALLVLVGCSSNPGAGGDDGGSSGGDGVDEAAGPTRRAEARPDVAPAVHGDVVTAAGTTAALEQVTLHLAVVVDEGGSCDSPPCLQTLELGVAGDWTYRHSDGTTTAGSYDPAPLLELAATVDGDAVAPGPFQGECPTVRNGTARTYLVFDPDAPETALLDVGSCRDQIDAAAPIIETLDLLLAEARR